MTALDLDAIAEKWLQQCGPCDAGLPMGCSHPSDDYRPVIAALLDRLAQVTAERDAARLALKACADVRAVRAEGAR